MNMCNEKQQKLCSDLECIICYNRSFASHERNKNWSEKNELSARQVFKSSNFKYFLKCFECNHEFERGLNEITNGSFCPYCANKKLCDNNDCQLCYQKSFASHEINKNWSEKNELSARQVFKSSNLKYFLKCFECNHEFEKSLHDISNKNQFCPYCANQKLCDNNDCESCYEKSFASHERSKNWSEKNELSARQVFKKSDSKKHLLKCEKCTHEFKAILYCVTVLNCFCPYCAHRKLCDNNECKSCYEKSFANHEKSKNWSEKNKLSARQVFMCSGLKYWFICDHDHEFEIRPKHINENKWCSKCVNKTEQMLYDWLLKYFQSSEIKTQVKFEWCKNDKTDKFLPFDFVIDHLKIIIELDGEQHFSQIMNWKSPVETLKYDKYKMECANKNNYNVIRLLQEDVYNGKYNWQDRLIELLIKHNEPKNFFIGAKIEKYDKHIE